MKKYEMRASDHGLLLSTIMLAIAFWVSTATTPTVVSAFQNWLEFINCGVVQQEKLQRAANILSDRLYEAGGATMESCLRDAFLSNVDGDNAVKKIWLQLLNPGPTIIECTDSFRDRCGGGHEWWGCARHDIGGEQLEIANHFLLDPNTSEAGIAGVIVHEISHNRGYRHEGLGPGEYPLTVTEQVRSCVEHGMPNGPKRSDIPVEVELSPAGKMGGNPFALACRRDAFGRGLTAGHGRLVDSLALHCTDGTVQGPAGNVSHQPVAEQICNLNEVLVGVQGRSGDLIDQLGAICAPTADLGNLEARRGLGIVGGDGGLSFASMCPANMAVRRIHGREGRVIDRVQVICEAFSPHQFSEEHTPHTVGEIVGGSGGNRFQILCPGKGAMQALLGRSGRLIDRLSAVCQPTQGFDPVILQGPQSIPTFAGGHGGTEFMNGCAPNELMVGLNIRSGQYIDAVEPVCADAIGWDRDSGTDRHGTGIWHGGGGGTTRMLLCPPFQFVVGLNGSSGRLIDRLQLICRDLR